MTVEKLLEGCEHDGSYIPVDEVKRLMKEYARIKCLEAIKKTRYKSIEVLLANDYYNLCKDHTYEIENDHTLPENEIQNISNQDVMPEL